MTLDKKIIGIAEEMGACHCGFADISPIYSKWPDSFDECSHLPAALTTGISIGVLEDVDMLMNLPHTDNDYRTKHYAEKIDLALKICGNIAALVNESGFTAHLLSHPPIKKATGLYKGIAVLAGLGWVGKNRLFVSPANGCHVALGAVLTDAPLPVFNGRQMENRCGNCTRCMDICPVHAYQTEFFGEANGLDGFRTDLCSVVRGVINPTGWGVCGLCVKACPIGKGRGGTPFVKQQIENDFVSECAAAGDFNNDGVTDITVGPYWYEGPDFIMRHEIFAAEKFDRHTYSKTTQPCFAHDFNGDGFADVFCIERNPGPGGTYVFQGWEKDADGCSGWRGVIYKNPAQKESKWIRHVVLDNIANEAPVWGDINKDGRPELIYSSPEHYGYAAYDPANPYGAWTFFPVSENMHFYLASGAGYGDITGNGTNDLIGPSGWWENPGGEKYPWNFHPQKFSENAAQMYVFDIDGDGLNDILTVWHCHGYGLVWHKQTRDKDGKINWQKHEIFPADPFEKTTAENLSSMPRVSQLHSLEIADINGDGINDIIVGKRFWAHGEFGDPEPEVPAEIYWLEIIRERDGVRFIPHLVDGDSGAGTQITAVDLNNDGKINIFTSNKKGVFIHR